MSASTMSHHRQQFDRSDLVWLLGLLLVSAILRLPALEQVPPGFQFDETYNALDALRVLDGERPIFLAANAGREVLYTYWQVPFVAWLGPTAAAGRLASAIPGIATVLLLYVFVRILFPERPRSLAGYAGLALAGSYWHLHFSRYGIRSITVPFWILLALLSLWLAMRDHRLAWYAATGVALAALVWTHPVGRIVPFIVAGVVLAAAIGNRAQWKGYLVGLALCGLVALVLFVPLGRYFVDHRSQFLGHPSDVSVFSMEDGLDGVIEALFDNALRVVLMFNVRGDAEWIHNLPGRPVFDPLGGLAFVLGTGLAGWRLLRRSPTRDGRLPYMMLFVWIGVVLLASVFSDMAPNYSRTIGAAPAVMILFALGMSCMVERLRAMNRARLGVALAAVVFLYGLASTTYDYFLRFGQDPRTPYHYDSDKIQAAEFVVGASEESTVYLARLWARQATVQLITRDVDLRSVETDAAMVLPAADARSVLYCYPPEQAERANEMAAVWAAWGKRSEVYDDRGQVLLYLFEIDAEHRPAPGDGAAFVRQDALPLGPVLGETASFEQGIALLGYALEAKSTDANAVTVDLFWQAARPIDGDYTFFLHLFDARGELVAQVDRLPGDASYRTPQWRPGDIVIERCPLALPDCLPSGDYELRTGWYDLATGERLHAKGGVAGARVGYLHLDGITTSDRSSEELVVAGQEIAPGAWLRDVSMVSVSEVGRSLDVAVRVAVDEAWSGRQVMLQLQGESEVVDVASWVLPDVDALAEVCLSSRARVSGVTPGRYAARLMAAQVPDDVLLGQIELTASTRLFDPPAMSEPVGVDLDGIRLLGANLVSGSEGVVELVAGDGLTVQLVWQLLRETATSYTVFLHLTDDDGRIVAQSDSVPMNGAYPTSLWVPDEIVIDTHELALPADLAPGVYHLRAGLYDSATGLRLSMSDESAGGALDAILLSSTVRVLDAG